MKIPWKSLDLSGFKKARFLAGSLKIRALVAILEKSYQPRVCQFWLVLCRQLPCAMKLLIRRLYPSTYIRILGRTTLLPFQLWSRDCLLIWSITFLLRCQFTRPDSHPVCTGILAVSADLPYLPPDCRFSQRFTCMALSHVVQAA